jgi:1-acylglycerone phosphate reductase
MAKKRIVVITGCSDGGLGAALAHAFHNTGTWRVIATARNPAKLTSTRSAGIETMALDVLDSDSIAKCAADVSELTCGHLDMLINNAGGGYSIPVLDAELATTRKLFELNVFTLIPVSRAFFPLLRATPNSKLVNNTSGTSVVCLPLQGMYSASKAAAASITEALRIELQPFDIQVVDLKTGSVRSQFAENAHGDLAADIPANSPYRVPGLKNYVGREASINRQKDGGMDAGIWARRVVSDLDRTRCSPQVWRGNSATLGRLVALLPIGMFDGMLKKMTGLDGLEAAIRASDSGKDR